MDNVSRTGVLSMVGEDSIDEDNLVRLLITLVMTIQENLACI